jgi:hypothetical protein
MRYNKIYDKKVFIRVVYNSKPKFSKNYSYGAV